jgi:hypothetical protein
VETSSRGFLDVTNAPDVAAPNGFGGTWLIDPNNIEIVAGGGSTNTGSTTINRETAFESTDDTAQLGVDLILTALRNGTVRVTTGTGGTNAQDGNITLSTPLDFNGTGAHALTLNAANDININQQIFDSNPGDDSLNLELFADTDGNGIGNVNVTSAIATGGGYVDIVAAGVELSNTNSTINTGIGNIILRPSTTAATIGLGDSTNGTFSLNTTELNTLLNSSGTVFIGRTDGTGTGAIEIGGQPTIGGQPIDLSGSSFNLNLSGGTVTFTNRIILPNNKSLTFNTGSIVGMGTLNAPDITAGTVEFFGSGSVNLTTAISGSFTFNRTGTTSDATIINTTGINLATSNFGVT